MFNKYMPDDKQVKSKILSVDVNGNETINFPERSKISAKAFLKLPEKYFKFIIPFDGFGYKSATSLNSFKLATPKLFDAIL